MFSDWTLVHILSFRLRVHFHDRSNFLVRILDRSNSSSPFWILDFTIEYVSVLAILFLFPSHFITIFNFVTILFASYSLIHCSIFCLHSVQFSMWLLGSRGACGKSSLRTFWCYAQISSNGCWCNYSCHFWYVEVTNTDWATIYHWFKFLWKLTSCWDGSMKRFGVSHLIYNFLATG